MHVIIIKTHITTQTELYTKTLRSNRSVFVFYFLHAAYVCRLRTFHSLPLFKCYLVTFPKVVERNILKFAGMKEEILRLAFPANKTVAFVHKPRNCSFLHFLKKTTPRYKNITEHDL